ncbi:hypothetical protein WG901_22185 [Novosphingobium sp. PS1R-30]|uniref:DUF4083 domain-containing protein n=1 Tax=Novosphingobium anseongense TaxID=3133436 RepID=A0ABU8S204_9SPHN
MADTVSFYILWGLLVVIIAGGIRVRIYMFHATVEQRDRQDVRKRIEHIRRLNKESRRSP